MLALATLQYEMEKVLSEVRAKLAKTPNEQIQETLDDFEKSVSVTFDVKALHSLLMFIKH